MNKKARELTIAEQVKKHGQQATLHLQAIHALMPLHGPSAAYDELKSIENLLAWWTQFVSSPSNDGER